MIYDVCLIYLPKPYLREPDAQAPLGLMYLASSLERYGKTVTIENYASYSDEKAIEYLPPANLYGITITAMEVLQANRFAKKIRSKFPKANIVVGGPGTICSEYIDFNYIDSVCVGDGEKTIHDIYVDAVTDNMRQLYVGETIQDLDCLEFPARHLLKNKQGGNIFAFGEKYKGNDSTIIVSSRGCPFKCSFCTAPALNNGVRFRSPKAVAAEMKHVKDNFGISQFRFSDDMFTASKRRVIELCEAIGKEDVYWRISCRVDNLDKEILSLMYQAGCRELSFGIESFDDNVLKGLNKRATAIQNVLALEMSHDLGFKTRMLFMIRTPFQTKETIEINKFFIKRVPHSIIACTGFIPIPGSDIWENPDKYNIEILDRDLDKYNFYMFGPEGRRKLDPIIKIKDRSIEEFHKESEEFRDWLEEYDRVNKG